jgi:septum formation protein
VTAQPRLILASSSPRRLALLRQLGLEPDAVHAPDIDETPHRGEVPRIYAQRMAQEKAATVAPRFPGCLILACDTTVALGRRILPPAESDSVVAQCLALLSGRRHRVYSAVTLRSADGRIFNRQSISTVRFKRLSQAEIDAYVASREGLGKAGGYAIQGRAAGLIDFLSGSYTGIVGLPLYEVRQMLAAAAVPLP